jgi:serine/threonine protein kinase
MRSEIRNKSRKGLRLIKSQKGGKLLGKGGFGCVIKPYVSCSSKKYSSDTVSKIIYKRVDKTSDTKLSILDSELKIARLLNILDPTRKYFCTHLETCNLGRGDIPIRDDISAVKFETILNKRGHKTFDYKKFTQDTNISGAGLGSNISNSATTKGDTCKIDMRTSPSNIIMPYCGIELKQILKAFRDMEPNKKYSTAKSIIEHQEFISIGNLIKNNFKKFIKKLLHGLHIMHNGNIIHHDIKPENILINIEKNSLFARYIDYNLSEYIPPEEQIKSLVKILPIIGRTNGTRGLISPELYIMNYGKSVYEIEQSGFSPKNVSSYLIKKVSEDIITYLYKHMLYLRKINYDKDEVESDIYRISDEIYRVFFTGDSEDIYSFIKNKYFGVKNVSDSDTNNNNITDGYWYKIDIFSMGLTIYRCAVDLDIDINDNLADLIKNMIRFDPSVRFNVNQCLKHPYLVHI